MKQSIKVKVEDILRDLVSLIESKDYPPITECGLEELRIELLDLQKQLEYE